MKGKIIVSTLFVMLLTASLISADNKKKGSEMSESVKNIVVKDMSGKDVKLGSFEGKVLLIVNVASKCGYTPQYKGLEAIYDKYKDKGLEILAFPCNDFGGQEPGTIEEIQKFCTSTYDVSFKLFDKIKVLGEDKSPLYTLLTGHSAYEKGDVKWNFEKFLVDKKGNPVARFRSKVKPESEELTLAIEAELNK